MEAVKHKRVFRLMAQDRLRLPPHAGYRPVRAHEDTLIALVSNPRWSSDALDIGRWNGELVHVVCIRHLRPRDHRLAGRHRWDQRRDGAWRRSRLRERRFASLRALHSMQCWPTTVWPTPPAKRLTPSGSGNASTRGRYDSGIQPRSLATPAPETSLARLTKPVCVDANAPATKGRL